MPQNKDLDPQVVKITEDFIKKAGLDNMPEEIRMEYVEKIGAEIQRRIGLIAMDELDNESAKELSVMLEKDPKMSQKSMTNFFKEKIENFDEKIKTRLEDFLKEYLDKMQSLKK